MQPSATLGSPLHASVSFAAAAPASAAASEVKGELENLLILNECIYAAARHLGGWWWGEISAAPAPPFCHEYFSLFLSHLIRFAPHLLPVSRTLAASQPLASSVFASCHYSLATLA